MQTNQQAETTTQYELSNRLIDSDLFSKVKLTASARLVLIVLCRYYPRIYPCQQTIAKKAGMSLRSVINAISELKQRGLILVECNHNNVYKFTSILFELAGFAHSTGKTCSKERADFASYKTKDKNNTNKSFYKSFNNNYQDSKQAGIKYQSANEAIRKIKEDRRKGITPLDFDKEQAINYLKSLPEFAQKGFYARELRKKWNL